MKKIIIMLRIIMCFSLTGCTGTYSGSKGYGYMAPYYSENGKLCIYDVKTKEIIELEDK